MESMKVSEVEQIEDESLRVLSPHLREKLTRQQKNKNPMKFYEAVTCLGDGSMGSVIKVKKRVNAIGGSARRGGGRNDMFGKILRCLDLKCCGLKDDGESSEQQKNKDIFYEASSSIVRSIDLDSKGYKLSSIIKFEHKDTFFALKSIQLKQAKDKTFIEELKNEIEILKTLDHPNIVRPIETYDYGGSLYLVLELCSGGDLYVRDPYDECTAAHICHSIISAVAYMHERGISHRDLKYENVMFLSTKPDSDIKIIDFGLSKKYRTSETKYMSDQVGTVYSMSPELMEGNYTNKTDIWSCGVLLYMLLSSAIPFYGKNPDNIVRKVKNGRYDFRPPGWKRVSRPAKKFVEQLLQYKPANRPSAAKAAKNPWLKDQQKKRRAKTITQTVVSMNAVQASIENYSNYNTLKKLALMMIAHKSTSDEIGFLRRMAKLYTINQGGVTIDGFKEVLSDYDYTDEEIHRFFRAIDVDCSGKINYYEFLAATIEAHGCINEERLAEAFDRIDSDDSGYITIRNLRELLGSEVPEEYLNDIIDEADVMVNDKQISYGEFLQMWGIEGDKTRQETIKNVTRRRQQNLTSNGRGSVAPLPQTNQNTYKFETSEVVKDSAENTFRLQKEFSSKRFTI